MKSINFKESNCGIGFTQEEYNGIYAHREELPDQPGAIQYTMCFELSEAEKKQVAETGCIWLKRLQPKGLGFHPIGPDLLKPEGFEQITPEEPVIEFIAENFDILTLDLTKVNYFYKKQAVKHLGLKPEGKSEEDYDKVLLEAQSKE